MQMYSSSRKQQGSQVFTLPLSTKFNNTDILWESENCFSVYAVQQQHLINIIFLKFTHTNNFINYIFLPKLTRQSSSVYPSKTAFSLPTCLSAKCEINICKLLCNRLLQAKKKSTVTVSNTDKKKVLLVLKKNCRKKEKVKKKKVLKTVDYFHKIPSVSLLKIRLPTLFFCSQRKLLQYFLQFFSHTLNLPANVSKINQTNR